MAQLRGTLGRPHLRLWPVAQWAVVLRQVDSTATTTSVATVKKPHQRRTTLTAARGRGAMAMELLPNLYPQIPCKGGSQA